MVELSHVMPGWEIEEMIGRGAYGTVYRIKKEELGYTYYAALKVIELPSDEKEVSNLQSMGMDENSVRSYYEGTAREIANEIRIMESLKSAGNIVHVEEHALIPKENGVGWTILIRMELLESLRNYQLRMGPPDVYETVKIGKDICSALQCCNEKGIIHRDVKPDNVFRNEFGMYKLGDFGIARQMQNTLAAYSQKGTMGFLAPEVYRGGYYDNTVDIYSLGVMLYVFMNRQRPPFVDVNTYDLTAKAIEDANARRLSGEPLPPPVDAPPQLAWVILKACHPDPGSRFQSALEFRKALESCEEGELSEGSMDALQKTVYINYADHRAEDTAVLNAPDAEPSFGQGGYRQDPYTGTWEGQPDAADAYTRAEAYDRYAGGNGPGGGGRKTKTVLLIIAAAVVALAALFFIFKDTICKWDKRGYLHRHKWEEATCFTPQTCSICGTTEGEPLEHIWKNATCTEPQTCRLCGTTKGEALGHEWEDATCTEPRRCSRCRTTEGEALGHDWIPATYDDPQTCSRCGATEGNVKGYVPYDRLMQGDFSEEEEHISYGVVHPYVFEEKLENCRKIKIGVEISNTDGDPFGEFGFWVRSDGEWKRVGTMDIDEEDKLYINTFIIDPALSIDALTIMPTGEFDHDVTWANSFYFYEAQVE